MVQNACSNFHKLSEGWLTRTLTPSMRWCCLVAQSLQEGSWKSLWGEVTREEWSETILSACQPLHPYKIGAPNQCNKLLLHGLMTTSLTAPKMKKWRDMISCSCGGPQCSSRCDKWGKTVGKIRWAPFLGALGPLLYWSHKGLHKQPPGMTCPDRRVDKRMQHHMQCYTHVSKCLLSLSLSIYI